MFIRMLAGAATAAVLCCFLATSAGASARRDAHATVHDRVIHVGGAPFFPVMLIDQCSADSAARAQQLGVNLILNESCAKLPPLHTFGVLPIGHRGLSAPHLVGWTYPDEPETNGWTPTKLQDTFRYRRGNADGLIAFVTTGAGFFRAPYRDPHLAPSAYASFARTADVAGFDLYPLGHCDHDLSTVYDAQVAFNELAGNMPTFQWIETGPIRPEYCGGFSMTPAELKAEVFLAVAGGARGIGYFTHTWSPEQKEFDVTPSIEHAMQRTDALLSAVRPGLLGDTVLSGSNSGAVKVLARVADGRLYVFAINSQQAWITAQLHVPRLNDGRAQVVGERRSIAVGNDRTTATFAPLAVHVYVQRL